MPKRIIMPGESDKPDANTLLLLHFDGNIIDSSQQNTVITNSGITFSIGKFGECAHKTGAASLTLPGSYFANLVALDEFTVDLWCKEPEGITNTSYFFIGNDKSGDTGGVKLMIYVAGPYYRIYAGNSGNENYFTLLWTEVDPALKGAWKHIAWGVKKSMQYLFVNGILLASGTIINRNIPSYPTMMFDRSSGDANTEFWMDEFRVSNVARWTSNFTPPTKPY